MRSLGRGMEVRGIFGMKSRFRGLWIMCLRGKGRIFRVACFLTGAALDFYRFGHASSKF